MIEPDFSDISLLDDGYVKSLRDILSPKDFQTFLIQITKAKEKVIQEYESLEKIPIPGPGEIPKLHGLDIYGGTRQLSGTLFGGDRITYLPFDNRYDLDNRIQSARQDRIFRSSHKNRKIRNLELNKRRAGLLIADVAGHSKEDVIVSNWFHYIILTAIDYDLYIYGEVTTHAFETANKIIYKTSGTSKTIAAIYGEIWDNGRFRFMRAGSPAPSIFSNKYNGLINISEERFHRFMPIGTIPSEFDLDIAKQEPSPLGRKKKYSVNEINLMDSKDILVLYSDGLHSQVDKEDKAYFPKRLEEVLQELKHMPAREIYDGILADMMSFGPLTDDISLIIVKRN